MTYLELTKKLGLLKLFVLLLDELGYPNKEIADKLDISEPTIYNARKEYEALSEALKIVKNIESLRIIPSAAELETTEPKEIESVVSVAEQAKKEVYGNPEVAKIIDTFKQCFGTTTASKYDRWAAHRLAKKYGGDEIVKVIQVLSTHMTDKYCPTVNSVSQLDKKWVNVAAYFNRIKGEEAIDL